MKHRSLSVHSRWVPRLHHPSPSANWWVCGDALNCLLCSLWHNWPHSGILWPFHVITVWWWCLGRTWPMLISFGNWEWGFSTPKIRAVTDPLGWALKKQHSIHQKTIFQAWLVESNLNYGSQTLKLTLPLPPKHQQVLKTINIWGWWVQFFLKKNLNHFTTNYFS